MKVLLCLVLLSAPLLLASPCPASATLDVYLALGGCEMPLGTISNVQFADINGVIKPSEITFDSIQLNGDISTNFIVHLGVPVETDDFLLTFITETNFQNSRPFPTVVPVVYDYTGQWTANIVRDYEQINDSQMQLQIGAVPEPASLMLWGTGLSSLSLLRFRRKR